MDPEKPTAIGLAVGLAFFGVSTKKSVMTQTQETPTVISPEAMLEHWQGHRRVTRRMILAFPEDKLFAYSIGGMRPFSDLVMEFIGMTEPGIDGVATGNWNMVNDLPHHAKNNLPKISHWLFHLQSQQ